MTLFVALAGLAQATTFTTPLSLDDLAVRSDRAVHGRVVSVEGVVRAEQIWTLARIHPETGPDVDTWVLGGCLAERDLCMTVAGSPRPAVGEHVFVFLRETRVTGLSQGWFVMHGESGIRDLSGIVFADGRSAPVSVELDALRAAATTIQAP